MHVTESDAEITGTKRQFMSKIKHIIWRVWSFHAVAKIGHFFFSFCGDCFY